METDSTDTGAGGDGAEGEAADGTARGVQREAPVASYRIIIHFHSNVSDSVVCV